MRVTDPRVRDGIMAKRWYIVHAYSNFEKKVADDIKKRAKAAGLADLFEEVLVPMEEIVEVRRGRKVQAERGVEGEALGKALHEERLAAITAALPR